MLYFRLFLEFFKIGLFSLGGGLATIPFLIKLSEKTNWFSLNDLTNMLAISESSPGPIGINMSTYVGYHIAGIFGAILSTFALVLPSYIIVIFICTLFKKFNKNKYIDRCFEFITPTVTALLGVASLNIFNTSILNNGFDIKKIFILFIILYLIKRYKKHPIFYIGIGGILGIILNIN